MSIYRSILRIAARLAAETDVQALNQENRNYLIKKIKESRGIRDPKGAKAVQDEVDDAIKSGREIEGFIPPFNFQILDFIRNVPDDTLKDLTTQQRKSFVRWLCGAVDPSEIPTKADFDIVFDYWVSQNHDLSVLGKKFDDALTTANEYNNAKAAKEGEVFNPKAAKVEDFKELDSLDGYRFIEINKSSRPGPDATEAFLKEMGSFTGWCIGSTYGKKIANGDMRAFVVFDPRGNPVVCTDIRMGTRLGEIKGVKNSDVSEPNLENILIRLLLRNFKWDDIKDAESGWAQIAAVTVDPDDPEQVGENGDSLRTHLTEQKANPRSADTYVRFHSVNRFSDLDPQTLTETYLVGKFPDDPYLSAESAKRVVARIPIDKLEWMWAHRIELEPYLMKAMLSTETLGRLRDRILKYPYTEEIGISLLAYARINPMAISTLVKLRLRSGKPIIITLLDGIKYVGLKKMIEMFGIDFFKKAAKEAQEKGIQLNKYLVNFYKPELDSHPELYPIIAAIASNKAEALVGLTGQGSATALMANLDMIQSDWDLDDLARVVMERGTGGVLHKHEPTLKELSDEQTNILFRKLGYERLVRYVAHGMKDPKNEYQFYDDLRRIRDIYKLDDDDFEDVIKHVFAKAKRTLTPDTRAFIMNDGDV